MPEETGTLTLSQEKLDDLHDALVRIEEVLPHMEAEQKDQEREKVVKDNFVDKVKTKLTPDEEAKYKQIATVFSTHISSDILKIQDGLSSNLERFDFIEDIVGRIEKTLPNLESALSIKPTEDKPKPTAKSVGGNYIKNITDTLKSGLSDQFKQLSLPAPPAPVEEAKPVKQDGFGNMFKSFTEGISAKLSDGFQKITKGLSTPKAPTEGKPVEKDTLGSKFKALSDNLTGKLTSTIQKLTNKITIPKEKEAAKPVKKEGIGDQFKSLTENLSTKLSEGFQKLTKGIIGQSQTPTEGKPVVKDTLGNKFKSFTENITHKLSEGFQKLTKGLGENQAVPQEKPVKQDEIGGQIKSLTETLTGKLSNTVKDLKQTFAGKEKAPEEKPVKKESFGDKFKVLTETVTEKLSDSYQKLTKFFKDSQPKEEKPKKKFSLSDSFKSLKDGLTNMIGQKLAKLSSTPLDSPLKNAISIPDKGGNLMEQAKNLSTFFDGKFKDQLDVIKKEMPKGASKSGLQNLLPTKTQTPPTEETKEEEPTEKDIPKLKSTLTSDEKARFKNISKIFTDEWMSQLKKVQQDVEKKNKLTGAQAVNPEKSKSKFAFLSNLLPKKKETKKVKKKKEEGSWITTLLKIFAVIGLFWGAIKAKIIQIPDQVWAAVKEWGEALLDFGGNLLSLAWESLKSLGESIWAWISDNLKLDVIAGFFENIWNTLSGWFGTIWGTIKGAFDTVVKWFTEIPTKIWNWITDAVMGLIQPILDGLKAAWDWLCNSVGAVWGWITDGLNWLWNTIKDVFFKWVNFWKGIWDWFCETFSWDNIWGGIQKVVNGIFDWVKGLLGDKVMEKLASMFKSFKSLLPSWLGGTDDEEEAKKKKEEEDRKQAEMKKKRPKVEVKNNVTKVISKSEEITLKDNLLETVKAICDRMNIFFSAKQDGFIDLSKKLIESAAKGFDDLFKQISKLKVQNIYNIHKEDEYDDEYDQSDKSTRTITYDYRKTGNDDFRITYNNIDLPALDKALKTIEEQGEKEVKLLESQNDYLVKMIANLDDFSKKAMFINGEEKQLQQGNNIIALQQQEQKQQWDAIMAKVQDMKKSQSSFARILGNLVAEAIK